MLIELGKEYNNVYHIDTRGFTAYYEKFKGLKAGSFWYDELHPKSKIFGVIEGAYSDVIICKTPSDEHFIKVTDFFSKENMH